MWKQVKQIIIGWYDYRKFYTIAGSAFVEKGDWEEKLKQLPGLAIEIIKAVMKK